MKKKDLLKGLKFVGKHSIKLSLFYDVALFSIVAILGMKEGVDAYSLSKQNTSVVYDKLLDSLEDNNNLREEERVIFQNEELLNAVLPCYSHSYLNWQVLKSYDYLNFKYFDDVHIRSEKTRTLGYYSHRKLGCINLYDGLDTIKRYETIIHEYIHLLQVSFNFDYLLEASAELISSEYFDKPITCYQGAVKNLKILLEIVGPDVIWKLNFDPSGEKEFNALIRDNMLESDADKLFSLLKENPTETEVPNLDEQIHELLRILYFNMYGEKMSDNFIIGGVEQDCLIHRYYFCDSKIKSYTPKYLQSKTYYVVEKVITDYTEYESLREVCDGFYDYTILSRSGYSYCEDTLEEDMKAKKVIIMFKRSFNDFEYDKVKKLDDMGCLVQKVETEITPEAVNSYMMSPEEDPSFYFDANFIDLPTIYDTFKEDVYSLRLEK